VGKRASEGGGEVSATKTKIKGKRTERSPSKILTSDQGSWKGGSGEVANALKGNVSGGKIGIFHKILQRAPRATKRNPEKKIRPLLEPKASRFSKRNAGNSEEKQNFKVSWGLIIKLTYKR